VATTVADPGPSERLELWPRIVRLCAGVLCAPCFLVSIGFLTCFDT
jgi:hypothetical protein